jgi:hypothetical protein
MDSFIADKISDYFSDKGFASIQDRNFNVAIGRKKKEREREKKQLDINLHILGTWGNETGKAFLEIQKLALPAVQPMVTTLTSVTAEEYATTMNEAFKEVDRYNTSTRFRLVYAIKP